MRDGLEGPYGLTNRPGFLENDQVRKRGAKMKRSVFLLISLVMTAILFISFIPAGAQDIDLSNMDNAQLMLLMQSIINKLDEKPEEMPSPTPTALPTPTATPEPVPDAGGSDDKEELMALMQTIMQMLATAEQGSETEPAPELIPTEPSEPSGYSIYENKKLTREKIPDYYFIQPEEHKEHKEKDKKDKKEDSGPTCRPGCNYECGAHGCRCVCNFY